MTIHLDLNPETEALLTAQAAAKGMSVDRYLTMLIEQHFSPQKELELYEERLKEVYDREPDGLWEQCLES